MSFKTVDKRRVLSNKGGDLTAKLRKKKLYKEKEGRGVAD